MTHCLCVAWQTFICISWCCSVTQLCLTLCDSLDCSMSGFPIRHYLSEFAQFMSIESVMPSNHLILCHPLLLLPSIFLSIKIFSNQSALHIKVCGQSIGASASASVLPVNIQGWFPLGLTGLISFLFKGHFSPCELSSSPFQLQTRIPFSFPQDDIQASTACLFLTFSCP